MDLFEICEIYLFHCINNLFLLHAKTNNLIKFSVPRLCREIYNNQF